MYANVLALAGMGMIGLAAALSMGGQQAVGVVAAVAGIVLISAQRILLAYVDIAAMREREDPDER